MKTIHQSACCGKEVRRRRIQSALAGLLIFLLFVSGCTVPFFGEKEASGYSRSSTEAAAETAAFDAFLEEFFRTEVTGNTINLHFTVADPQNYGIQETPVTLGEISEQALAESAAGMENLLSVLDEFDYRHLDTGRQLTCDVIKEYLKTEMSVSELAYYDELLRPSTGIQAQLPVLYEEYRFYEKKDVEDYLALIVLTDEYFSQIIAFEQKKAQLGLFMSDFACDTIISQCETFIKNPEEHYLIQTFERKVDQMEGLTESERESYKVRNETAVKEHVLPAYRMLADALTGLLGTGKNEMGLCYLPDGKEYYEYLVRHNTGSGEGVEEIQRRISEQRNKDLTEAAVLLTDHPDLKKRSAGVALTGRDSIATLEVLKQEMASEFPEAPEAEYTVSYIDACMEEYMAPAFYITAPIDDYGKNAIFINASTDVTSMRYFTTLAHEGFPGHLYQTVMSYEAGLSPARTVLNFPGYVEGWATYVEMISYGYAGLEEELASLMSHNQSALLSLYASTDLGIHYDGWSFSDAAAFWETYGITDQNVLREIYELIVEEPAHYLKYYVGYLEFLRLKETAQRTYGSDYSDIAFHRAVLEIGPAPFPVVEQYLDAYYDAGTGNN